VGWQVFDTLFGMAIKNWERWWSSFGQLQANILEGIASPTTLEKVKVRGGLLAQSGVFYMPKNDVNRLWVETARRLAVKR